jgi:uncharacterized protein YigE (DUF2233 family)
MRLIFIVICLFLSQPAAFAQVKREGACSPLTYNGADYTVCKVAQKQYRLRVFWKAQNGMPFASLRSLESERKNLYFSMNGGMYDWKLAPIGLYVENGVQLKPLSKSNGWGNFHLKPNGVFYVNADYSAGVLDAASYAAARIKPQFATQSGPMLVVNGKLHPKFQKSGTSRKYRNGVGVVKSVGGGGEDSEGTIYFAISKTPVTFTEFATLFRDKLKTQNALYLDGSVSSLRFDGQSMQGGFRPLGPMIGAE